MAPVPAAIWALVNARLGQLWQIPEADPLDLSEWFGPAEAEPEPTPEPVDEIDELVDWQLQNGRR